jgi:Tfp pilus assembly protein PilV
VPRGFSLIETTIAAGLLATVLVALAYLVAVATQGGSAARLRTSAITLAAQKAEELRTLPWSTVALGGPAEQVEQEGVFERLWTAAPAPFNSGVLILTVRVRALGPSAVSASVVTARARRTP